MKYKYELQDALEKMIKTHGYGLKKCYSKKYTIGTLFKIYELYQSGYVFDYGTTVKGEWVNFYCKKGDSKYTKEERGGKMFNDHICNKIPHHQRAIIPVYSKGINKKRKRLKKKKPYYTTKQHSYGLAPEVYINANNHKQKEIKSMNTNIIKIESGIPLPLHNIGLKRKEYDFIYEMSRPLKRRGKIIYESFKINGNTPDFSPKAVRAYVYGLNANKNHRGLYSIHTLSGTSDKPTAIRVFRVK